MIVTSFTLRSPCPWKLQCDMYVLQFYLNLFSVVLAQLRLTLQCRCIDASTSTHPHLSTFTSSHAHIRRSTSPPHYTHTSARLYHMSLLHICPVFLSFYISFLSSLCTYIFARSHPQIYLSTSIHLQIYIAPAHHTVTPSHPPSFSLSIHLFDSAGQLHVSLSGQPSSSLLFPGHDLFGTRILPSETYHNHTGVTHIEKDSNWISRGACVGQRGGYYMA